MSIIEYLDETRPQAPLLPKNAFKKSQARTLALIIGADIQPVQVSTVKWQSSTDKNAFKTYAK